VRPRAGTRPRNSRSSSPRSLPGRRRAAHADKETQHSIIEGQSCAPAGRLPNALSYCRPGAPAFVVRCRLSADGSRGVPSLEAFAPKVACALETLRHRRQREVSRIERLVDLIPRERSGHRRAGLGAHGVGGRDALAARVLQAINVYGAAWAVVESALDR